MSGVREGGWVMAPFKLIEKEPEPEPGRPVPKKGRPPDRVLFWSDGRGLVYVQDWIGPAVSYLMEDGCGAELVKEEVASHPFPGLWVWEGWLRTSIDYWGEHDEWLKGVVRPLDEDEYEHLKLDDEPWDRDRWYEPEKPAGKEV
jgi:hypothetical protein